MGYLIPTVIEKTRSGEAAYDLYSRLLKDRIVFVQGEINSDMANIIVAQLLYLEKEDPKSDIYMYINSPGGAVYAGLAIYDTMQHISCDITTIAVGVAASFAALILAGGTANKRMALPNSTVLIHQPLLTLPSESTLQTTEIEITAKESIRLKKLIARLLSKHTGKSVKQILNDIERDYWMDANMAKEYGIIDKILNK